MLSRHVDFVLCNANHLPSQSVVDLDDPSHDRAKRQGRDGSLDSVLQAVQGPVFHFRAKRGFTVGEVREVLTGADATPFVDKTRLGRRHESALTFAQFLAVVLAGVGLVTPILGAIVHEASAMLVVMNAVRLIEWHPADAA